MKTIPSNITKFTNCAKIQDPLEIGRPSKKERIHNEDSREYTWESDIDCLPFLQDTLVQKTQLMHFYVEISVQKLPPAVDGRNQQHQLIYGEHPTFS